MKSIKHPLRLDNQSFPLSDAILEDNWMYVSGQGPVDVATGEFKLSNIVEETKLTMENIRLILAQENLGFEHIVKCNVHLADIHDFDVFNRVYAAYFPGTKPARTTVQLVLMRGILVEIDCVAKKP